MLSINQLSKKRNSTMKLQLTKHCLIISEILLNNSLLFVKMVSMPTSMHSAVQACVVWGASISEFFDCSLGVKQGYLFSLSSYLRLLILS